MRTWHQLVAKNHRLLKAAWHKATHLAQSRIPFTLRFVHGRLQPVYVQATSQPIHPIAALRQNAGRSRYYSTGVRIDKASFPKSRTATAVNGLTGRTPFASTLRPNLTGGTLCRSAGGYGLGSGRAGGVRYFSHAPSAPAEVIQNVSQAVRAFWLGGKKAQYDGTTHRGEKRFRAVSTLQDQTARTMSSLPKATPGSFIDFAVNPTITALTPLSAVAGFAEAKGDIVQPSLNSDGLLDILSADFSRALKDLAAVLNDLKRLSDLGDLPITYHDAATLRIHFPGCDAGSVEALCQELDVKRGVVGQDEDFDVFAGTEIALLFPFASSKQPSALSLYSYGRQEEPIDWKAMIPPENDQYSVQSETSYELFEPVSSKQQPSDWSPEGYESLRSPSHGMDSAPSDPLEYQDFEGIYRFIELCDGAR